MKFRTKLYTSIGSIVVLISICVIILINMLEQSMVNIEVVVTDKYERINMASTIKYETVNISRELRGILVNHSNETLARSINNLEQSNIHINQAMESLERIDSKEKTHDLIAKYKVLYDSYLATVQQVIEMKKMDSNAAIEPQMLNDSKITGERMIQLAEILRGLQEQEMKNELYRSRDTYHWAVLTIYFFLAISLSLGIGFIIWIIRGMTKNLNEVTTVMKSVTNSNPDALPRIEIFSNDEIGAIAAAFNKMVKELEAHSKREQQLIEEAEEHSWLKTNIAELVTMYPEAKDVHMLAELFISKLVPMVGASNGVFYIKTVEGNEQYLKKIAAYAFFNRNREFECFRVGEGLIGQCALEKQPIFLNQVPDNYIKIHSGMGEASPKNISILPIKNEGEVLAVIEIASFESFSPTEIKLFEEVIPTTGITLKSILNQMKAERLLQESQSLTEELQTQSEELQLQQEELRTTNEQLEEEYTASVLKKEELENVREELEEKAQQLEISSQYKSEFLANMSHELRTPLNSLLILAQILSENDEGNLTAKQMEYIRTIYSSGNDLLHLINDILDLAKVEAGKLEVIHKEVNFHSIEDYILKQFSPIAHKKKIQFKVQVDPDLPSSFYTDKHRLQQILTNLLSNAFKFTESGSVSLIVRKVMEKTPRQQIFVNNHSEFMLAFSVIDTGIGIAKEQQATIFDAFKQADGTTSRKYGGTGLGLSICREIAYLLGGFIELKSDLRKGSDFTLYLPFDPVNELIGVKANRKEASAGLETDHDLLEVTNTMDDEESRTKHLGISSLKDKKVLIVDDDIRNVYALTIALEKYEMDILVAENGREGIEILQANPNIDLILMDIMMPKMDGFEAIRTIRNNHRFTSLPIIALTAKAMKHSREECLDAGATDYISKPIDLDQLFSLMHVWLYRKEG